MVQIYLPMPQNISDTMSVGYAEDTLNPLQVAGLKVLQMPFKKNFQKAMQNKDLLVLKM